MDELKAGDPTNLGEYRLLRRLGAGVLSIVFLAVRDGAPTARRERLAIKVLRPRIANDVRFCERLERDANRIMSVTGRHTARVVDIVTDGSSKYLVAEYVDGESLEKLVANGRRIRGPLLWFVAEGLVDALREIHSAGLVHRNLKPSNVLIGSAGVKVTDFGFGGILDEGGLVRPGSASVSASWLSPEQISGSPVDARTDIFNLGMILATIARGEHPYAGTHAEDTGATPQRAANAVPVLEDIASPMREMIARCLSVDPTQRPGLSELGSFFGSGGIAPTTQPIPIVEPVPADAGNPSPEIPLPPQRIDQSVETKSLSEVTPPTLERVEPVHIGREYVGFHMMEELSMVDHPYEPDSRKGSAQGRGRMVGVAVGAVLALAAAAGVVDATNVVDLGLVGANAPATTIATTTTSTTSTTTTVVVTTTVAPPPVYRIYAVDGTKYRWNPCQNPIKILLNPTGKLTPGQQAALEAFLTAQAGELALLTGMTIQYAGLTEEVSGLGYAYGEEILLHIDVPGAGVLTDDKPFEGTISGDRIKDGFREIDAVNLQYNSNALQYLFLGDELHTYGQWLVMLMLGNALGLDPLAESDMSAAGSNDPEGWEKEVMFYGGRHLGTPTWGPGDRQGLAEVGASAGCF